MFVLNKIYEQNILLRFQIYIVMMLKIHLLWSDAMSMGKTFTKVYKDSDLKKPGTIHPMTEIHIPEDWNLLSTSSICTHVSHV
jgi:hypothetical protein